MANTTLKQNGYSLLELMLGLALSMILLLMLGHILINNTRTVESIEVTQQLQNTALYAQHYLSQHIRHSAYRGDTLSSTNIIGTAAVASSDNCQTSEWTADIRQPLLGSNQNQVPYPCLTQGTSLRWFAGDTITVRYSNKFIAKQYINKLLYSRSSLKNITLFMGEDRALSNNQLNLPSSTRKFNSYTFYISRSNLKWCNSTKIPALTTMSRAKSGKLRRSITIAGIEQLQIQYSRDLSNFMNADTVSDWKKITRVKVWILVRSLCRHYKLPQTKQFQFADINVQRQDRYRRQLFSFIVSLRNDQQ
ncbi:hypothetical protein MNBD_GAMMA12-3725 [hydrothermal vent metagenome]|uniref:Type IV fimbrial biogenesis protein PilW n=1 Tax=hydrothermal vent metagenome TaxID=652676 RepID=A0A3B0YEW4_9ZZZZ